jgi:hypothetical protein
MSGDAGTLASGKKDACTLLTSAEIEAVQGEPVKETKASVQLNGEMLVSECLFHTTNFPKSVSVALAVPTSAKPSALAPRKFWQRQFQATDVEEDKMRAAGKTAQKPEPEEEEARKPRRIEGLGEEAYWVGPRSRARSMSCKEIISSASASEALAKNPCASKNRRSWPVLS